jgi:hypothetical protein
MLFNVFVPAVFLPAVYSFRRFTFDPASGERNLLITVIPPAFRRELEE